MMRGERRVPAWLLSQQLWAGMSIVAMWPAVLLRAVREGDVDAW